MSVYYIFDDCALFRSASFHFSKASRKHFDGNGAVYDPAQCVLRSAVYFYNGTGCFHFMFCRLASGSKQNNKTVFAFVTIHNQLYFPLRGFQQLVFYRLLCTQQCIWVTTSSIYFFHLTKSRVLKPVAFVLWYIDQNWDCFNPHKFQVSGILCHKSECKHLIFSFVLISFLMIPLYLLSSKILYIPRIQIIVF